MESVCWSLGALCLIYYGICVRYAGFRISWLWVWPAAGAFLGALGGGIRALKGMGILLPKGALWGLGAAGAGALLLLAALLLKIAEGMRENPAERPEVLVVLGARVKGRRPTRALAERIRRAEKFLRENPGTWAVLSGGQGPDEEISEAEAMGESLKRAGISPERLLLEDKSTNTRENLAFSRGLIPEEAWVGIVTSDFHMTRSLRTARRLGYLKVCGLAAPLRSVLLPHYLLRECAALLKDWISYDFLKLMKRP